MMNVEFQSAVHRRYSHHIDILRGVNSTIGQEFTAAGPQEYQGDILEQPDLLWTEDQWDESRVAEAEARIQQQGEKISTFWRQRYEGKADYYWHQFYIRNTDHFYKDRHYLHVVFPELMNGIDGDATAPIYLLEVGCGVGNAILPLLEINPRLCVTAVDFAASAIKILDKHPLVEQLRTEFNATQQHVRLEEAMIEKQQEYSDINCRIRTAVCCVVNDHLPVPHNFMDLVLCMFVLSAISPAAQMIALRRCADALKVGGKLMIRDYGRYDEAQLRFKKGSKLDENFYVRQDGTCSYFFTIDQLKENCAAVGLEVEEAEYVLRQYANRQQRKARYRVWVHAKFRKV